METFLMVGGMALVTFGIRYVLLPLSGRLYLNATMQRALSYVPPAVLTAIIAPMALMPDGQTFRISLDNAYLAGTIATVIVGKLSKNMLVTIVGGMIFFGLWQWVTGGSGG